MNIWKLHGGARPRKARGVGRTRLLAVAGLLAAALIAGAVPGSLAIGLGEPPFGGPGPEANVEFNLPDRAAADELISMGADLVEYVRDEPDGTITINAWVTPAERLFIESLGYRAGRTVEDQSTYEARMAERQAAIDSEERAHHVAEGGSVAADGTLLPGSGRTAGAEAQSSEVTVMRADYFTHRSGTFLSVEARTSLGTPSGGPTMAMSWREESGAYGAATTMSKFTDAGQYMYHRILVRIGPAGATSPVPFMVQVASSTPASSEKLVTEWVGRDLPPLADGYMMEFWTHYADPVEVYDRMDSLAAEFPGLAEIINLPNQTAGYQRKSMAVMAGAGAIDAAPANASQAVLLIATRYGQSGGNDTQAEFVLGIPPPATPNVVVTGNKITVNLAVGTTAIEVVNLINASPAASALVTAYTYAGNAGTGTVQPRLLVNLDDFLDAPASIPRGPFQPRVIRIGAQRDGSKVGVFLFCQEHAREWVTPLVCAETAERLLRNYAIDPVTQELVDNLDIFILPSYNPDGSLYSFYDFASQRKNMTRYCSLSASNGMPASQNQWGVDLNRNLSVGSRFDGYSGATSSCTGETFSGPSEVSEPETKNEQWLVDTFQNIKFSNNIHTYGGYFMWSPGAYITPGRITLPAPNIGIEAYFFEGADDILTRIKEYRGTAILPSRTGPVADVLYSAAGNSADDQWYRRNIIAFSFEAGADLFTSTTTGTAQTAVGFMPAFSPEGFGEYNEFASGNLGLLEKALQYANDTEKPVSTMRTTGDACVLPATTTFDWVNEPSVIHYTTDGSTPTLDSPTWEAQGPRQPGEEFTFTEPTTLKWIAVDIKGNVSDVQTRLFGHGCTDLALTKAGPSGRAPTGRNMTYTLTVTNGGPEAASDVVVTDTLPPTVTFVSATPNQGSCGETGGVVTCNLGSILAEATATINIVVKPTQAGVITNTASVSASAGDLDPSDNNASVDTNICRITSRRSSIPCG
ncbi:MAG TPA: M14 family zinc carboxypeptidase [Actinomycetota bacterium]|nr:M14 family zinc carboxypeptidase [Actinomycetota bacterium]